MTDLMKSFLAAEDENAHTESTLIIARAIKGKVAAAFIIILEEIDERRQLNGFMMPHDGELRDIIQRDVLATAKLQNLI